MGQVGRRGPPVNALRAVDSHVARWERVVAVALLAATVVIIVLQVFFRYVLDDSLGWSEEAARYLFIWAAVLGFSSSVAAGKLFTFELVYGALPPAGRRSCDALFAIAAIVFVWTLVVDGSALVAGTMTQHSPAIGVPMAAAYAALPVGGVLVTLHLIAQMGTRSAAPLDEHIE